MIIGIGGISNAGKSRLARKIASSYHDKKVLVICQDDYAFPTKDIPTIRDHTDWERPESLDFESIHNDVIKNIPEYDVIIVEGIFALKYPITDNLFNKRIYLTLEKNVFIERKNEDLRWGKEPEWYVYHIWNNHMKYRTAEKLDNMLEIDAGKEIEMDNVMSFLKK